MLRVCARCRGSPALCRGLKRRCHLMIALRAHACVWRWPFHAVDPHHPHSVSASCLHRRESSHAAIHHIHTTNHHVVLKCHEPPRVAWGAPSSSAGDALSVGSPPDCAAASSAWCSKSMSVHDETSSRRTSVVSSLVRRLAAEIIEESSSFSASSSITRCSALRTS